MARFIKAFAEMTKKDFQEAGGKAANLGELTQGGFNVPPGFCVVSEALDYLIEQNGLAGRISDIASSLDFEDFGAVEDGCAQIREMIEEARVPSELYQDIVSAIDELCGGEDTFVAVRSSVAVKGSKLSSFPGMMDTFHYLKGHEEILRHIRMCWASLWTTRAAMNRYHKGIEHHLGLIAPVVQKMVNPEVAGIMFTANPITGSRDEIVIESNWGLGESVVSGKSMNDFFVVDKTSRGVTTRKIARKTVICCFDEEQGWGRKETICSAEISEKPSLVDEQVAQLTSTGLDIESWFSFPQDIEWAFEQGRLFILQSRAVKNLSAA